LIEAAFASEGQWFKGNLHTHTTESDGRLSPKEVTDAYRDAGYDFVVITDHEKVTDVGDLTQPGLLVMPGVELARSTAELGQSYHIVCLNVTRVPQTPPGATVQEVIAATTALGGEAFIAHPSWSGLTFKDLLGHEGLLGIEVYNTTCDMTIGKGYSTTQWDDLLARGLAPLGLAVDDLHRHPRDFAQGWIMVRAEELTQEAVMAAIRTGHFYSSTGPDIHHVELHGGTIHVSCSPVMRINFICATSRGHCVFATDGKPFTDASFEVGAECGYVRVECVDERGKTAWTNAKVLTEAD